MSLVHLCMPSKRPANEVNRVMGVWRECGYRIVLQRDVGDGIGPGAAHEVIERPYAGYPEAVNFLAKRSLAMDPECMWIVCAGDDTTPDHTHTADEIAAQCAQHFFEEAIRGAAWNDPKIPNPSAWTRMRCTFGVMQPTGDDWSDHLGRIIERIAGSPWMGRSWCERINQGTGPLWHEYRHNWADEELQLVAQKYGAFWQRRDLTHHHDHAMRKPGGQWQAHQLGFSADYAKFKPLFERRRAAGFPGSEPL